MQGADSRLDSYTQKRRFEQNPEPPPGDSPRIGGRFCVQRHQASRLHYDLRLEVDGVLKSWAVPKGPSRTPGVKRLAVQTEDHPLEYLEFEGVIPEGHYGAGVMMVFDIGIWEPAKELTIEEALEQGELKFRLWGQKLQGGWTLVRSQSDQWLWLKSKDQWVEPQWDAESLLWSAVSGCSFEEIAQGKSEPQSIIETWPEQSEESPLPLELAPMLARVGEPFDHPDWLFEMKWDGVRALSFCEGQSTRIVSRKGHPLMGAFPEFTHLRARCRAQSFVLDGEIAVLNEQGEAEFARLSPRLHVSELASALRLARLHPAVYYVFDLLYLDGHDLRGVPLEQRLNLLEQILRPDSTVRRSQTQAEHGTALYALVEERGLEGLVAKHRRSTYAGGRSDQWLKLKPVHTTEAVVVGYTAPRGSRQGLGSLVLARYEGGQLRYIGRVGSGLTNESARDIKQRLDARPRQTSVLEEPVQAEEALTWCEPHLVVEVEYGQILEDGKLRFPVFVQIRHDLTPAECGDGPEDSGPPLQTSDGRLVKISNPNKVLFPAAGYTKMDLVSYYQTVSRHLLGHLKDRPLSLRRFPDGIEGEAWFQKHPKRGFPEWLETLRIDDGFVILCQNSATLLYLSNLACIELHTTISRVSSLESPDGIIFDLDPQPEATFDEVITVAGVLKQILDEISWQSYLKTSGSKGLHIFVPLRAGYTFEQTRLLASIVSDLLAQTVPDLVTLSRNPNRREKHLVYIDTPQNHTKATMASPYSVRALPGAPVSTPLSWDELTPGLALADFNIATIPARLDLVGDLWVSSPDESQDLESAVPILESLLARGKGESS